MQFDAARETYDDFAHRLRDLLRDLLGENDVRIHSVTSRTKTRDSLLAKLSRPDASYSALEDITDLAAVRVTTYFADDVDRVGQLIEREFLLDRHNSVDKRAALDPDRFGYLSLHYVVQLSTERARLTENRRYPNLRAEVQIRSILQHAWAEIEHDLGYKGAAEVPRHVRRRFSRIAGLLELADQEFASIRAELSAYERELPSRIVATPDSVALDKASLTAFIQEDPTLFRLDAAIARHIGVQLDPVDPANVSVTRLRMLGLDTIGQLRSAVVDREDLIRRFAEHWVSSTQSSNVKRGIALFYLRYVLLGERKDRDLAKRVLATIFSKRGTRDDLINDVFATYDEIAG